MQNVYVSLFVFILCLEIVVDLKEIHNGNDDFDNVENQGNDDVEGIFSLFYFIFIKKLFHSFFAFFSLECSMTRGKGKTQ